MKSTGRYNEKLMRLIAAVLSFAALAILLLAIVNIARDSAKNSLEALEKSIRRSVMACYASEGVYPPNVEYLEEHYGLQVDKSRFLVDYEVFAGNLMPEITVLERTE